MKGRFRLGEEVILKARPELGPWVITQIVGGKTISSTSRITIEQEDDVLPGLKVVYPIEIVRPS